MPYTLLDGIPFYTKEEIDNEFSEGSVSEERERAEAAEQQIASNLSTEVDRATAKENALQTQVQDIEGLAEDTASDLATEVSRATAADQANASAITAETTRATNAEQDNANAISAERNRALLAEGNLSNAIIAEAARATAAEQDLQEQLDNVSGTFTLYARSTAEQAGMYSIVKNLTSALTLPTGVTDVEYAGQLVDAIEAGKQIACEYTRMAGDVYYAVGSVKLMNGDEYYVTFNADYSLLGTPTTYSLLFRITVLKNKTRAINVNGLSAGARAFTMGYKYASDYKLDPAYISWNTNYQAITQAQKNLLPGVLDQVRFYSVDPIYVDNYYSTETINVSGVQSQRIICTKASEYIVIANDTSSIVEGDNILLIMDHTSTQSFDVHYANKNGTQTTITISADQWIKLIWNGTGFICEHTVPLSGTDSNGNSFSYDVVVRD